MFGPTDLKKGVVFKYRDNPQKVLDYSHTHKGRGGAVVNAKVKDLITGTIQVLSFKGSEKLQEADLARKTVDFLYADADNAHFMEADTFEQISLPQAAVGDRAHFLKEGSQVTVIEFEGKPIDIELPPKIELKVTQTEPGVKGDTASGTAYKPATCETGLLLQVPLFVKEGDIVRINTETGEYVERVMK